MFDPSAAPRLFALPPGADFPKALADGLWSRMSGLPPEQIARVEVFVNTRRMQRRLRDVMSDGRAALLPRIRLITDLGTDLAMADLPPAVPPLRRRLELTQLIAALLDRAPDLAPRSAIYDLAESLAKLMDEMQGEGVSPDAIAALDMSNHSGHWQRSLSFIRIVDQFFGVNSEKAGQAPDAEARQRRVIDRLTRLWAETPPRHPVIIAGSTGSRGATLLLMQAVTKLPQGAIILPGYDFDMPTAIWSDLTNALTAEDHPQFRFSHLLETLGATPSEVQLWHDTPAPNPARNALISLSLRPAPVTDQWMIEGQLLPDLRAATVDLTLIEASSPRHEAMAIALILRKAAQDGITAALITPDRGLTRQVTAALDRWAILPDDSAGKPLALSAPGRFLRHISALFGRKLTAETLLTLLKHPLTASASDRGPHLRWTRELELTLRRKGPQFPTGVDLLAWGRTRPEAGDWVTWLAALIDAPETVSARSLTDHVAAHLALAERLATGPNGPDTGELWLKEAGIEARAAVEELLREAPQGGDMSASDYTNLFTAILQRRVVRDPQRGHPGIMIWGTLEARVQGAELVILGGLNDGVWPGAPSPDPWLNRQMRHDAGLLLPERQIGLSAHDYQQAIAAPKVILTRAARNAEAETVASRWVNRLTNLMGGLPGQHGPEALQAMRDRGTGWLRLATAIDLSTVSIPAEKRPAPRPPVAARPRELYVSQITKLIRDPYAVYARHILRLKPLDPLRQLPDAQERGNAFHTILQNFIQTAQPESHAQARDRLLTIADTVLADDIPWPEARRMWRARLERVADWFLAHEAERPGTPKTLEETGSVQVKSLNFKLSARPDRIDLLDDGRLTILDYKTGAPPSARQQLHFDKQLLLEAAMAEHGAFTAFGPRQVASITYIGLGTAPKEEHTEMEPGLTARVWSELADLITRYMDRAQGYTSRRAMHDMKFSGDYDHLARYGEWDISDTPAPANVGPDDEVLE